ncbi:hypothetical protein CALCODRAFT_142065 [Calocera cornea HHB12733]|uniref:Uncharacterized protein n=1 Tax=Calocera cornea HHB12733 TaxID=1353952 RepID=A0A165I5G8_9BASI|nr:hypothetical protein CALCODRAFT_142065 [Calocera cornea HHB12733]
MKLPISRVILLRPSDTRAVGIRKKSTVFVTTHESSQQSDAAAARLRLNRDSPLIIRACRRKSARLVHRPDGGSRGDIVPAEAGRPYSLTARHGPDSDTCHLGAMIEAQKQASAKLPGLRAETQKAQKPSTTGCVQCGARGLEVDCGKQEAARWERDNAARLR